MKNIAKILFVFVLLINFITSAQTTLTVTQGAATLDGVISSGEYTSTPLVTPIGVTLYAMDDGYYFYLAATWADTTESINKSQWSFDGSAWSQTGNEDRIAFIFDMGLNDPDGPSCLTMCHGDGLMRTNHGFVDVWHWKSHRGNPMGYTDDKYWDTVDRQSDPGTSTYSDNDDDGSGNPTFMATNDPGANVVFLVKDAAAQTAFDPYGVLTPAHTVEIAVPFNLGATFSQGDVIPGYVLRNPDGDRASVMSAGKWDNGTWTVEFKRKNSGSNYDFWVPGGGMVDFTHEIFDNTGGSHPNDGFDATIYTLDFTNIVGVGDETDNKLPTSFVLNQNFPNPFNPETEISYSLPENSFVTLKVFDILGNDIQILVNEKQSAGNYSVKFDAGNITSGIYLYKLEAGNFVETKKMLLLK